MDYLEIQGLVEDSPLSAPNLKLVNQVLEKGYIIIDIPKFVYLLRLAFECKLYNKIRSMKEFKENDIINRCVNELIPKYPEYIKPKNSNIPESINTLIEKARTEHHLTHPERLKVGIAMQSQGYDIEEIVNVFRMCSDFNEKVTRYQLASLKRYIKPS